MRSWIVICLSIFVMSGCAITGSGKNIKKPSTPTAVEGQYELGVGDQIAIQVWKSPELSLDVPIRPDGKISAPLIGDVSAAGLTSEELAATLGKGFSRFVRNPQVTVIVLNPASGEYLRRVRITGAVEQPQSLEHRQGMTVLDLVLQAGGVTDFAVGNKAKLYRKYGEKMEVYPIHLDDILQRGRLTTNYLLAPSDIVTIPERVF